MGKYWGHTWTGGKSTKYLAQLWQSVFGRRKFPWDTPKPHHYGEAADVLRSLAECPMACKLLAEAIEIEIDGGDSAADFLAQMAEHEALKAIAIRDRIYADRSAAIAAAPKLAGGSE
jgi:hypothetical protein